MDIKAIAKQAGMVTALNCGAASCVWSEDMAGVSATHLKAFAALVAATEREACAKVCELLEDVFSDARSDPRAFADSIRAMGNAFLPESCDDV
jgi:hypothetical protein